MIDLLTVPLKRASDIDITKYCENNQTIFLRHWCDGKISKSVCSSRAFPSSASGGGGGGAAKLVEQSTYYKEIGGTNPAVVAGTSLSLCVPLFRLLVRDKHSSLQCPSVSDGLKGFYQNLLKAAQQLDCGDVQQPRTADRCLGGLGRTSKASAEGRQNERGRRGWSQQFCEVRWPVLLF